MTAARQSLIGISLAASLIAAWLALHIYALFLFEPFAGAGPLFAPLLIALICWLDVGLFIVAHDAMHGSLAPGHGRVNLAFGRVALRLYAGFSFDRLRPKHFDHHRHAGTDKDPDFSVDRPGFWPWYGRFFREYFGFREFLILFAMTVGYLLLGVALPNLLLFWALPSILSSVQLFTFGTFLPHRRGKEEFADEHRARSSSFGYVASLLSCFHFGYHHEHHLSPHAPWWQLPQVRRGRSAAFTAER